MPRGGRMKVVTEPRIPHASVISGIKAGRSGGHLIDIGAPPIPRHGVIYITEVEAAEIAEFIGWVDGDIARAEFARLEEDNRLLRAQLAELPLALGTVSEVFKDGLDELARAAAARFDDALAAADPGDRGPVPAWAQSVRATPVDGDGRNPQGLALLDGDDDADTHVDDGEDLGGSPIDGDRADAAVDGDPRGDEEGDSGAAVLHDVGHDGAAPASGSIAEVLGAAPARGPARITDLPPVDDGEDAGDR